MNYYEDKRPDSNNAFKNWQEKEQLDKEHAKRIKKMVTMIFYAQKQPMFKHLVYRKMSRKLIYSLDDYNIRDLFVHYYYDYIEKWIIEEKPEKAIYSIEDKKLYHKSIYLVDFKYNLDYIKDIINKEIYMCSLNDKEVNERIEYLIGEVEFCKSPSVERQRAMSGKIKNSTPVDRLVQALGGNVVVAKMLGITSEAVSRWKTHGIPNERLDMIELKIIKDQL